jgi:hypothetical protein
MDENEKTTYNMDRLFDLSSWMSSISWIFFAIGLFQVIGGTLQFIQDIPEILEAGVLENLSLVLLYLGDFPKGFIWILVFLIVRAVPEVIYIMIDIELNTRTVESAEVD